MTDINSLPIEKLRWICDPKVLKFKTTDELKDIEGALGQDRAVEALNFGASMAHDGYNIYALGPQGLDKHGVINRYLEERAETETPPLDLCYVYNFYEPSKPVVLQLPRGQGLGFKHDMFLLSEDVPQALRSAFDSEEYQTRIQLIDQEVRIHQEQAIAEIDAESRKRSVSLKMSPLGFTFVPIRDGKPMKPQEFKDLPQLERKKFEQNIAYLQKKFDKVLQEIPVWIKETREKQRRLNEETASYAVGHLVEELKKKYQDLPNIIDYLNAVQDDIIESVSLFVVAAEQAVMEQSEKSAILIQPSRYQVNLLVDNSEINTAPVIYENNPSYESLLGRIEHRSEMGALVTDFHLIRPGSLHEANGGYLIVDVLKLLTQPLAYEGLKKALMDGAIQIEPLGHALGLVTTVTLEPEPVPLSVKVVLVGERIFYYLLSAYDPEFPQLFKVGADFEESMNLEEDSLMFYAQMIGSLARREDLLPFSKKAVALVLEHSVRLSGNVEKLSTNFKKITDLLLEADFFAQQGKHKNVKPEDVDLAIKAQERRQGRLRERLLEETERGLILIDTEGKKIGQVNGLSVIDLGAYAFGHPSRITARVGLGRGKVIDIEREVELGGPLHSKGILILSGYLHSHYLADNPLSLTASLVFEQSYGGVEGDSASLAELCALLSAIAEVPLRQDLALTGSINQQGQIQAIGGVNEKIEGFFDLCEARGLKGTEGVLIPESNIKNLMLNERVLKKVQAGLFSIYPVSMVDQALELLTGLSAGEKVDEGRFTKESFNRLVQDRMEEFARCQKAYMVPEPTEKVV